MAPARLLGLLPELLQCGNVTATDAVAEFEDNARNVRRTTEGRFLDRGHHLLARFRGNSRAVPPCRAAVPGPLPLRWLRLPSPGRRAGERECQRDRDDGGERLMRRG